MLQVVYKYVPFRQSYNNEKYVKYKKEGEIKPKVTISQRYSSLILMTIIAVQL